jgi:hypothetical protein
MRLWNYLFSGSIGEVVNMVYQLSRDEVIKVCGNCERYEALTFCCMDEQGDRKPLNELRKCKKWDEYYGSPCLFHG